MTLDMNGNPVMPYYFKVGIIAGLILGLYNAYEIFSIPVEDAICIINSPASSTIEQGITRLIESIPLFIGSILVAIILLKIYHIIDKYGLPREDEIH